MTAAVSAAPRIAFVHDWLTGMRGGEKVLDVLCQLYPTASLFTLVHVPGTVSPAIERLRPHASVLSTLPGVARVYRHLLPLFPGVVEQFDLDDYDLVVSTSHCAAKSVVRTGRARHLCYCFTPMRYVWDQRHAYFGDGRAGWQRRGLYPVLAWLARWDAATAHRVDRYLADSQHVARRIQRYYNRRSTVVYPPVDTEFYSPDATVPTPTALVVSALVPYKRIDVAIEACRLSGVPLRIVGQGPEMSRLKATAGAGVEFLGNCTDEEIRRCYREAGVVLLPGEEDFGIVPVEAQACGRPVVALSRGGALETVVDGTTGILVASESPAAMASAIREALERPMDSAAIRQHAESFGRPRFEREIRSMIDSMVSAPRGEAAW
jgi:glycosyltransferase involved in cell wall biosynthesis